ncbi:MAG: ATP-binding protein [Gemmatimonadota bacterium]
MARSDGRRTSGAAGRSGASCTRWNSSARRTASPEQVPHRFTRFFRGDPARHREAESSGLGLAIARAGAEVHGGDLTYLGDSTCAVFRLRLPRRAPARPRRSPATASSVVVATDERSR